MAFSMRHKCYLSLLLLFCLLVSSPDYTHLWQVLGVALLIIGIILYWNRRLVKEIAQRNQTEAALNESETRYRLAMDAARDGIWDWNVTTGEVNYSPSWGHILDEEFSGNDYDAWDRRIHPDDKSRVLDSLHAHLVGDSSTWREEHRLRKSDNSWIWVLGRGKVVKRDRAGNPMRMLGTMTDINILKQTEAISRKLTQAVEQSMDSILITDINAKIEYVNQSFLEKTGYRYEEVMGRNPGFLKSGKTPPETFVSLWSALAKGQAWKGEFINQTKDGTEYVEYAHITPVKQPDGSISHYVAVKEDVTEKERLARELDSHRHHLEELVEKRTEQLKEAREQADTANQSKSIFLANMSHEIRTPMNAIIGMSKLAFDTPILDKKQNFIEKVHFSSNLLMRILNDILDFSKIEAGKLDIEKIDFSLQAVLNNLNTLIGFKALEKGLKLTVDVGPGVPEYLKGDPLRLGQILNNLGNNAIKFTKKGGIAIYVKLDERKAEKLFLHFCVSDTGEGMSLAQQQRLFLPFSQADNTTSRQYGGTGLGLAISKRLTEMMGGSIWVESELDHGSSFHFTLQLEEGESEWIVKKQPHITDSVDQLRGAKILLIEDNKLNQELAEELLISNGMIVTSAWNGQEALAVLQTESFDAVLMDIQMPVMDGYTTTRKIRKQTCFKDLPVIAMTANVMEDERKSILAAGMNDYIAKPVIVEEMLNTMAKWITRNATVSQLDDEGPEGMGDLIDLPGINIAVGMAHCIDKPLLYQKMLIGFRDSYRDFEKNFHMAQTGEEGMKAAIRATHSLAGLAGSIGAMGVQQSARALEMACKENIEAIEERLIAVIKELDLVRSGLARIPDKHHKDHHS